MDNFVITPFKYGDLLVNKNCNLQLETIEATGGIPHIENELQNIFRVVDTLPDGALFVDGGTNIGVNAPAFGYEVARQTKKYFRYQSGKGMMFTTGISMCPQFTITNVYASGTSVGSTITISTELDDGVQIGANIQVTGVTTTGYNTFYRVNSITAPNQFTVLATQEIGRAHV